MNAVYRELSERLKGEVPDLDRIVQRILKAWPQSQYQADQNVHLDSVALNLHSFYSGLERLFELIARHIDQAVPAGEMWHRDLLRQMADDLATVRPAVIHPNEIEPLDEFRRFRHLVRNIYTINLKPEKMESLISVLPNLWVNLQAELKAFADFLAELARATQSK